MDASRSERSCEGRSIRSRPSRCSRSNRNTVSGSARAAWRRRRGCRCGSRSPGTAAGGRRRPGPAPRRRGPRTHREREGRRDHLRQPVGDVVQAAGEDRDASPSRWIWTRMPSSFHSSAAGAAFASAAAMWSAVPASIGWIGRPTTRPTSRSPSPPRNAVCGDGRQVAGEHRGATHGGGRDLRGIGDRVGHHAVERPWRSSPREQPRGTLLLGGRAAEQRLGARARTAWEPAPSRGRPRRGSGRPRHLSSPGPSAGAGSSRRDAQPTPSGAAAARRTDSGRRPGPRRVRPPQAAARRSGDLGRAGRDLGNGCGRGHQVEQAHECHGPPRH